MKARPVEDSLGDVVFDNAAMVSRRKWLRRLNDKHNGPARHRNTDDLTPYRLVPRKRAA